MDQLITIETVPISIRYSGVQPLSPSEEIKTPIKLAEPNLKKAQAPKPRTDTYNKGKYGGVVNLTYTAKPKANGDGKVGFSISMNEADTLPIRMLGQDIQNVLDRLFGGGGEGSYDFQGMHVDVDVESFERAMDGAEAGFTPPSFEVEILEMPKVIVKYVGGPIYIPRSSDPDYEG